jgi:hypothetical protein
MTLVFTIPQPAGLKEIGGLLAQATASSGAAIAETIAKGSPPAVRVDVFPGYKCD